MASRQKSSDEITIIDVARAADVSYSTVSRVVNNKSYVKPETRARVLQVMDDLGYQANLQARSLAGGRTNVIGLLVPGLVGQYTGEIMSGVDDVVANAQYELMLYTTHRRRTRESALVARMSRGLADGLLLLLPQESELYLESLRQKKYPFVLIDSRGRSGMDNSVTVANYEGAYAAIQHLIHLGHHRIGFLAGLMDLYSAVDRLGAYKQALADHHIPYLPELVHYGDFMHPTGVSLGKEMLAMRDRPTAIFASSDMMAMGVMDAARACGLRIPEDLSLIGFDDVPLAAASYPRLTTVRQPLEEIGRMAAQILLRVIANPNSSPEAVILGTELIIRDSTAPPKVTRKQKPVQQEPLRR